MRKRSRAAAGAALVAIALVFGPALAPLGAVAAPSAAAAAASASSTLSVVDNEGRPVSAAVVALENGTVLGTTDAAGHLAVTVADGVRLVVTAGTRRVVVVMRARTLVATLPPATIGSVIARNDPATPVVTAINPAAVALGDVADALRFVPNYRTALEGGSGRQMVNGIPLQLPPMGGGGANAAGGLSSDLVDSFVTTQADDGTVTPNFRLLSPSAKPAQSFSYEDRDGRGAVAKATATGTLRRFGYALALVDRTDDGVLAGRTLLDASGSSYDHSLGLHRSDASISLSYAMPHTSISVVGLGSHQRNAYVETAQPGSLLAGVGAGSDVVSGSGTAWVLATHQIGTLTYRVLDVRFDGALAEDLRAARFAGVAVPSYSGFHYSGSYDELAVERVLRGGGSVALKYSATHVGVRSFFGASDSSVTSGSQALSLSAQRVFGATRAGATLTSTHDAAAVLGGNSLDASAFVRGRIGRFDVRLAGSLSPTQNQESTYVSAIQSGPPAGASFDCAAGDAIVDGRSNVSGGHPRARTLTAEIRGRALGGDVAAGGFRSVAQNALVRVISSAAPGAFDASYNAALSQVATTLCGGALAPDLYVRAYTTVPRLLGDEWYVTYGVARKGWRLDLAYETYALRAPVVPAHGAGVTSLIANAQLDGVPMHRAHAVLSHRAGGTIASLAAQYVDGHNAAHLPGHVIVAAGLQFQLGRGLGGGTLAISAQNLFHAYAGDVASSRYALPVASTGAPIGVLATPVTPAWRIRYTVRTGQR
ncbi:MAG TPA: hypothetical protein VGC72_18690 [Candidatus Elarobacter sp.]|jgi:hypothetical protein